MEVFSYLLSTFTEGYTALSHMQWIPTAGFFRLLPKEISRILYLHQLAHH